MLGTKSSPTYDETAEILSSHSYSVNENAVMHEDIKVLMENLKKFAQTTFEHAIVTDENLLRRYLKRQNYSLYKCEQSVLEFLEWRRAVGLDDLLFEIISHTPAPQLYRTPGASSASFGSAGGDLRSIGSTSVNILKISKNKKSKFEALRPLFDQSFFYMLPHRFDGRGRALSVMNLANMNMSALTATFRDRQILHSFFHLVFEFYRMAASSSVSSAANPKDIGCVLLFNAAGAGYQHLDTEFGQYLFNIMHKFYPGLIRKCHVFSLPWLLNSSWLLVKTFLPAEAVGRVSFVSNIDDVAEDLIDPDTLPSELGGRGDKYDVQKYFEYLKQLIHTHTVNSRSVVFDRKKRVSFATNDEADSFYDCEEEFERSHDLRNRSLDYTIVELEIKNKNTLQHRGGDDRSRSRIRTIFAWLITNLRQTWPVVVSIVKSRNFGIVVTSIIAPLIALALRYLFMTNNSLRGNSNNQRLAFINEYFMKLLKQ